MAFVKIINKGEMFLLGDAPLQHAGGENPGEIPLPLCEKRVGKEVSKLQ